MPITFCSGDIFETDTMVALAHGCNCAGAMGKGIAVAFKHNWPEMYQLYKSQCESGEFGLGDVFRWHDESSGRVIYNLGTQRTWKTNATLKAIEQSTANMLQQAEDTNTPEIAMPMIGAGLGGLAADDVKTVLDRLASDSQIRLLVCDEHVQGQPPK